VKLKNSLAGNPNIGMKSLGFISLGLLKLLVPVGAIGILFWYVNHAFAELQDTIDLKDKTIKEKQIIIDNKNIYIDNLRLKIKQCNVDKEMLRMDITKLVESIDKKNKLLEDRRKKLNYYLSLYKKEKAKTPKVIKEVEKKLREEFQREIDFSKATCEECLQINKAISEIDYDKDI